MDYATRSRAELLGLCKARGLSGAGTTEDLIERLQAQDAAALPADQDEDPLADDGDGVELEPPGDLSVPHVERTVKVRVVEPEPETPPVASESVPAAGPPVTEAAEVADSKPTGPDPRVKEGVTGNVFRFEFYAGRDIDDAMHRHFIAECHHNAHAAGHRTKGAPTVGHRVRHDADAAGKPTVVYEVYLARERGGGGQR